MKTTQRFFLFLPLSLLLILNSCFNEFIIRGNGIEESEQRYTSSFTCVKSSGAFDVHVSNSDSYEVVVNAETNILPYIETEVSGHTLKIDIRGCNIVRNTFPMEVFISTPVLEGIRQSGSGSVTTGFFTSPEFTIGVSGSGTIETAVDCHQLTTTVSGSGSVLVSGIADYADLTISGSGRFDAYDLPIQHCEARISGSGNIFVHVVNSLDATISGSGSIFYIGIPEIKQHISGSGDIINDN
jgi:hypothetical protein